VVAGTCIGFLGPKGVQEIEFDLCIVDEVSKASISEVLVPLARSKRWIVVGDRKQLPPFLDDALDDSVLDEHDLTRGELATTLLHHLGDHLPPECCATLTQQHRMRPEIGRLISDVFYDSRLTTACPPAAYLWELAVPKPVTWFSTSGLSSHEELSVKPSFKNMAEVQAAIRIVRHLDFVAKGRGVRCSVAFLTGYSAQRVEFER
jgi:superfamily I DNA and/or RNA helicase